MLRGIASDTTKHEPPYSANMADANAEATHSYFDWQVSTLMLAYDVVDPIARDDLASHQKRQQAVEQEVREVAFSVIPDDFQRNEAREFPPELVMQITRATVKRAATIVGLI